MTLMSSQAVEVLQKYRGKISVALSVVRQTSNRFCCLFLFSLVRYFSQDWGAARRSLLCLHWENRGNGILLEMERQRFKFKKWRGKVLQRGSQYRSHLGFEELEAVLKVKTTQERSIGILATFIIFLDSPYDQHFLQVC